jgi:hypothetical protein
MQQVRHYIALRHPSLRPDQTGMDLAAGVLLFACMSISFMNTTNRPPKTGSLPGVTGASSTAPPRRSDRPISKRSLVYVI